MEIFLQKSCGGQITRYSYDALNRLMEVEAPNINAHYTYDSFGRRLTKTLSTGRFETYLYQGEREIGVSLNGVITHLRVMGIGKGCELGAQQWLSSLTVTSMHHYMIIEAIFAVLLMVVLVKSRLLIAIVPLASLRSLMASQCPWTFASKRVDDETGFFYFGKRYYSPHLGSLGHSDPLGFADGPNLYAYVHNRPFNLIRSLGLAAHPVDRDRAQGGQSGRWVKYVFNCIECSG